MVKSATPSRFPELSGDSRPAVRCSNLFVTHPAELITIAR
jgi:hypothetical protein